MASLVEHVAAASLGEEAALVDILGTVLGEEAGAADAEFSFARESLVEALRGVEDALNVVHTSREVEEIRKAKAERTGKRLCPRLARLLDLYRNLPELVRSAPSVAALANEEYSRDADAFIDELSDLSSFLLSAGIPRPFLGCVVCTDMRAMLLDATATMVRQGEASFWWLPILDRAGIYLASLRALAAYVARRSAVLSDSDAVEILVSPLFEVVSVVVYVAALCTLKTKHRRETQHEPLPPTHIESHISGRFASLPSSFVADLVRHVAEWEQCLKHDDTVPRDAYALGTAFEGRTECTHWAVTGQLEWPQFAPIWPENAEISTDSADNDVVAMVERSRGRFASDVLTLRTSLLETLLDSYHSAHPALLTVDTTEAAFKAAEYRNTRVFSDAAAVLAAFNAILPEIAALPSATAASLCSSVILRPLRLHRLAVTKACNALTVDSSSPIIPLSVSTVLSVHATLLSLPCALPQAVAAALKEEASAWASSARASAALAGRTAAHTVTQTGSAWRSLARMVTGREVVDHYVQAGARLASVVQEVHGYIHEGPAPAPLGSRISDEPQVPACRRTEALRSEMGDKLLAVAQSELDAHFKADVITGASAVPSEPVLSEILKKLGALRPTLTALSLRLPRTEALLFVVAGGHEGIETAFGRPPLGRASAQALRVSRDAAAAYDRLRAENVATAPETLDDIKELRRTQK